MVEASTITMNPDFKPGASSFPLMTVINLSMSCQGKCISCPYENNKAIINKYNYNPFMDMSLFAKIAEEIGLHKSWLRLSGRETLLHPKIDILVKYAKMVGCKVGINTNGMKLSTTLADHLLYHDTDAIFISVDAADKDTYSTVRPGLDFDVLVKNVDYIFNTRNSLSAKTNIIASVVNQVAVKDKINDIVDFWKPRVDKVMVRKYLTWGFLDKSMSGDSSPYMDKDAPCPFVYERFNIDTSGVATICGYDVGFNLNIGDLNKQTIAEIWRSKEFDTVRANMKARDWEKLPLCKDCNDRIYRSWDYNVWKVLGDANDNRDKK